MISRLVARFGSAEQKRLFALAADFCRTKHLESGDNARITPEMHRAISTVACVPILNLGLEWYRGWVSVIVYPGAFLARHEYEDEAGVVHQVERPLSGEAWYRGPVIISWDDLDRALRGRAWGNVLIHELAHKLDLLNGDANGMPPLHPTMERARWTAALTRAFEDFRDRLDKGSYIPCDESAAEDPGEFFAVLSEAFFTEPGPLSRTYPAVYGQLGAFYRQDPAGVIS